MDPNANPYQAPADVPTPESEQNRGESVFWKFSFWSAVGLACLGLLAFFVPNLPPLGFLIVALILFLHTAIGSKRFRGRAIVGLLCTLVFAVGAFYHLRSMQAKNAAQRAIRAEQAAEQAALDEYERLIEEATKGSSGGQGSGDGTTIGP